MLSVSWKSSQKWMQFSVKQFFVRNVNLFVCYTVCKRDENGTKYAFLCCKYILFSTNCYYGSWHSLILLCFFPSLLFHTLTMVSRLVDFLSSVLWIRTAFTVDLDLVPDPDPGIRWPKIRNKLFFINIQATGEASILQKRTGSSLTHEISFLLMGHFALPDPPDAADQNQCLSGSGSRSTTLLILTS